MGTYPDDFSDVILRLGGMHMLMSFVGAVGTLLQGSGLSEVLESTFAGVPKMLSGKEFPQNVRAMRLVVEELLRSIMRNENITSMDELLSYLDKAASTSKTSKLWVDCLLKPVFIMVMYVRAEREGEWQLHLVAVKQMLPYFFAAAHVNYARYGLYYNGELRTWRDFQVHEGRARDASNPRYILYSCKTFSLLVGYT